MRQALSSSQATFKSTLADVQSSITGSSSAYHKDLKKQADTLDAASSDGRYHYGLEWPGTDHNNRSRQAAVVREESEGGSDKHPGNGSPIRFHWPPEWPRLNVQKYTIDLGTYIQRGMASSLNHNSDPDVGTGCGALIHDSGLSFHHHWADIHASSGHRVSGRGRDKRRQAHW